MTSIRSTFILAALTAALLAACGQSAGPTAVAPLEISRSTSCSLDGMLLADYPGPKAQIFYAGQAEPDFFCDTIEMFHVYLTPEQVREVRGIFVQDMGKSDWDEPHDHWIDAKSAYNNNNNKHKKTKKPTKTNKTQKQKTTKFAAEYGGKVYRFA